MPCCTRGTQSQPTSRNHPSLIGWLALHTTLQPTTLHRTPLHPTTPNYIMYIRHSHTTLHRTTVSERCFLLHCTLILPSLPHPSPTPFPTQTKDLPPITGIQNAAVLLNLGDSVTTDHISPAGSIARNSSAARYLASYGLTPRDFNSYGSRRGNDAVMSRGTFANIRLVNKFMEKPGMCVHVYVCVYVCRCVCAYMCIIVTMWSSTSPSLSSLSLPLPSAGPKTKHFPSGEEMDIFDAAERYCKEGRPVVVLAGKEYGSGSSRDWAAKGPWMLVCGKRGDGRAPQGTGLLRARGCWCVGRGGMGGLLKGLGC